MKFVGRAAFLATLTAVWVLSVLPAAAQVRSMKLVSAKVGWAAGDRKLFWTTDSGLNWRDITPAATAQELVASVFFLDASHGWVLFLHDVDNNAEQPQQRRFDIAITADGGVNWSIVPLRIPNLTKEYALGGDGRLDFVDAEHGWMNLGVESSAAFRSGILLLTHDGGQTWDWAAKSPGVAGDIYFKDLMSGWLAGGPGYQFLYVTHDGSKSWQEVSPRPPATLDQSAPPLYRVPSFEGSKRGLLPVTYLATGDSGSIVVIFSTDDGGSTWKPSKAQKLRLQYGGPPAPSDTTDREVVVAEVVHSNQLTVTRLHPDPTKSETSAASIAGRDPVVASLSFSDAHHGWLRLFGGDLRSTSDGGTTSPTSRRSKP